MRSDFLPPRGLTSPEASRPLRTIAPHTRSIVRIAPGILAVTTPLIVRSFHPHSANNHA